MDVVALRMKALRYFETSVLFVSRHGVTSQKNFVYRNTAVITFSLAEPESFQLLIVVSTNSRSKELGLNYDEVPCWFSLLWIESKTNSVIVCPLHLIFWRSLYHGGTVVKALCYKSEGRWFDSRWFHWNFSLT